MFSEKGIGEFKGLFSIDHLIFTLLGFIVIVCLFHVLKKKDTSKIIIISFISLTILEILKIIWTFTVRSEPMMHHWVPLYFCSLYLYASGFYTFGFLFKKEILKRIGLTWIVYGQMLAGLCFLIYPSSSIGINPILHVLTFHSFIYHVVTILVGLLILKNKLLKPNKKDLLVYGTTTFIALYIIYNFNLIFKTNLAFINEPFMLPPLEFIYNLNPILYNAFAIFGHIYILFYTSLSIYSLVMYLHDKK